jgi:tetratricopeptide (TPR) repeat protein
MSMTERGLPDQKVAEQTKPASVSGDSAKIVWYEYALSRFRAMFASADKTNTAIGIATGLISIIAASYLFYLWVAGIISHVVTERLAPYQGIIMALSLNNNDDHDKSIDVLYPILRYRDKNPIDPVMMSPLVDAYLEALANSEEPLDHTHDYEILKEALRKDVSSHPWRKYTIGMYLLRSGDVRGARTNFRSAVGDRRTDGLPGLHADAHWGISLSFLAEGNVDDALVHLDRAGEIMPGVYGRDEFGRGARAFFDDWRVAGLRTIYNSFANAEKSFLERIRNHN